MPPTPTTPTATPRSLSRMGSLSYTDAPHDQKEADEMEAELLEYFNICQIDAFQKWANDAEELVEFFVGGALRKAGQLFTSSKKKKLQNEEWKKSLLLTSSIIVIHFRTAFLV